MINYEECPICLINEAEYYTECNHKYCITCLCRIKKCSLCCKKLLKSQICDLIKFKNLKTTNLKILLADTNILVNLHANSRIEELNVYNIYNNDDSIFNYYNSTLNPFIIQACICIGIKIYSSFFKN
jgi:hypothetical protein